LAGSVAKNVTFASEQMQAAEHSQLRSILSSDDFNRQRHGWHGTFYPLGKTGWVKLGKKVSFTYW